MIFRESDTVELKQSFAEDIRKDIIAFANSTGGKLYIGVADNGDVIGIEEPDKTLLRITNMVRDSIRPDITMFISYNVQEINHKQIITIEIQRGSTRPYYFAQKGMRPEGVYVRQGTSSVPATDTAIRRMIKETDGDSYEEMRSLNQELTFAHCITYFSDRKVAFGPQQMKTLGLLNSDGIFTNLGLLLSDQCMHTVKVATFEGTSQYVFNDRREFQGSLLTQLSEIYEYIDIRNKTHAKIDKLFRVENRDYPEVAVREALLNSLVHRDYSYSSSTLVSVYEDRLEFVSIGGLMSGISLNDIMLGLSVCRNPKLANIFYRLQLIEAYGTGIRKIMTAYQNFEVLPKIEITDNAFKITLPNMNIRPKMTAPFSQKDEEKKVLELIKSQGSVSRKDIENVLHTGQATAGRLLKRMQQKGSVIPLGKGKNTRYVLPQ